MEQKTLKIQDFAAVQKNGNGVLGKVLYYSLSSILIDKEKFSELCQSVGFPYQPTRRTALAEAFRSATGDIYERMVLKTDSGPQVFKVYCRDNKAPGGVISRELIKETVHEDANEYKKLANLHVDPLPYCLEAQRLFDLYQNCIGRRQPETLLENYVDSMQAVKNRPTDSGPWIAVTKKRCISSMIYKKASVRIIPTDAFLCSVLNF